MLKAKHFQIVFVAVMAMVMSMVMSFAMTAINVGFVDYFLQSWTRAFLTGYVIAFPTALVVAPLARMIATGLTKPADIATK